MHTSQHIGHIPHPVHTPVVVPTPAIKRITVPTPQVLPPVIAQVVQQPNHNVSLSSFKSLIIVLAVFLGIVIVAAVSAKMFLPSKMESPKIDKNDPFGVNKPIDAGKDISEKTWPPKVPAKMFLPSKMENPKIDKNDPFGVNKPIDAGKDISEKTWPPKEL